MFPIEFEYIRKNFIYNFVILVDILIFLSVYICFLSLYKFI